MTFRSRAPDRLRSARPRCAPVAAISLALLAAGCASFSPDAGLDVAANVARVELGKDIVKIGTGEAAADAAGRVRALVRKPLTADAAVQIALLGNRGLQAAYNDLGISEAQYVQASLPPSPTLSLARLAGSLELEIERQLLVNLLALITLPARKEIAESRFQQAKLKAAEETLRLAADTRRAYWRAVASGQTIAFLESANAAARAVSDLFRKLGETGAVNKLDQAREHVFHAEIAAQLGAARLAHRADRERLTRFMGLWGDDLRFTLPAALPPLPRAPRSLPAVEKAAIAKRVDLEMERQEVETTARSLGLTNATRYVNVLEIAGLSTFERVKAFEAEYELVGGDLVRSEKLVKEKVAKRGLEIELQVPLFDFGEARTREAKQTYLKAVNKLLEKAVNVRSEAREAYQRQRGAYDLARHYQANILPLRQIISEETLLRYNAMTVDVFMLIAEARQRIASNVAAIEARRDFWIADTDLKVALVGGGGLGGGEAPRTAKAASGGGEAAH